MFFTVLNKFCSARQYIVRINVVKIARVVSSTLYRMCSLYSSAGAAITHCLPVSPSATERVITPKFQEQKRSCWPHHQKFRRLVNGTLKSKTTKVKAFKGEAMAPPTPPPPPSLGFRLPPLRSITTARLSTSLSSISSRSVSSAMQHLQPSKESNNQKCLQQGVFVE